MSWFDFICIVGSIPCWLYGAGYMLGRGWWRAQKHAEAADDEEAK